MINKNSKRTLYSLLMASTLVVPSVMAEATTISSANTTQQLPVAKDILNIVEGGSLKVNNDIAIKIDNADVTVNVYSTTANAGVGVETTGASSSAIEVNADNTTINLGTGGKITGIETALVLNNTTSVLNNQGTITSSTAGVDSVIRMGGVTGKTTTINNLSGGTIEGAATGGSAIVDTDDLTLTNANLGTIVAKGAQATIHLNTATNVTINNSGSVNATGAGHAIHIDAAQPNTVITSSGTVAANTGNALAISNDFSALNHSGTMTATGNNVIEILAGAQANISNLSGGMITAQGANHAIHVGQAFTGNIANGGTIESDTGSTLNVPVGVVLTGSISNSGTLKTTGGPTSNVQIIGTVTGNFSNSGSILCTGGPCLEVSGANAVAGGILNSGIIKHDNIGGGNVIDLSMASEVLLHNTAGSIEDPNGDILLSSGPGTVLQLDGGTITANSIVATDTATNAFLITGGTLDAELKMGKLDDTLIISGGSITQDITGNPDAGANHSILLNGSFSTTSGTGYTNIENYVLSNSGTIFTVNNTLGDNKLASISIAENTTLIVNEQITDGAGAAIITNKGTLRVNSPDNLNRIEIKNIDQQSANAHIQFELTDNTNFGKIQLDSASKAELQGSFDIELSGKGVVQSTVADLTLLTTAAGFNDTTVFNPPGSPTLTFTKVPNGNNIDLNIVRNPFSLVSQSTTNQGLAATLDKLIAAPPASLAPLIAQLDTLESVAALDQALTSLVPHVDNGIIESSFGIVNSMQNVIGYRQDYIRQYSVYNPAYAAGDWNQGLGTWSQAFANSLEQGDRNGIAGYDAKTTGFALGVDKIFGKNLVGLSATMSRSTITSKISGSKKTELDSLMFTLYGSYFAKHPWYFDYTVAFGINDYSALRPIRVGNISADATGDFTGWQYAGRGQLGYVFKRGVYNIAPMASMQANKLSLGGYTETGAGTYNLSISNKDLFSFRLGLGVQIAGEALFQQATYIPDFHIFRFQEYVGDAQQTQSTFTGAPASFSTTGLEPARRIYQTGVGMKVINNSGVSVLFNFDVEFKHRYRAYYGFMKLRYDWS